MTRNNYINQNQNGQVLIALVLTLLTILTIGLIVIQRSTTDISTSTQNDQASRAFSAAEAGIEEALQSNAGAPLQNSLSNDASYVVTPSARLPLPRQAFEYFPTTRGEVSQVWLADVSNPLLPPFYTREQVFVYFGDPNATGETSPAIEINLVTRNTTSGEHVSQRWFYDTITRDNGFTKCGDDSSSLLNPGEINTSLSTNGTEGADRKFKCRVRINTFYSPTIIPIMIRARVLYSDNQQFAVAPIPDGSATGNDLPPQATIYTSIGLSGQSRKTIQVLKVDGIVPFFFDYAVFSTADIIKTN
jgi:hypothetical protein